MALVAVEAEQLDFPHLLCCHFYHVSSLSLDYIINIKVYKAYHDLLSLNIIYTLNISFSFCHNPLFAGLSLSISDGTTGSCFSMKPWLTFGSGMLIRFYLPLELVLIY